jgi:GGDEF domain-containing protein
MISGLVPGRLVPLHGLQLLLLPLTLFLNAGLVWLARDLPVATLAALIAGISFVEGLLWLRSGSEGAGKNGQAVVSADETRLATLIQRSADVRRNSIRDEATGLYNRWYLDMRLEEEGARCRRYGLSMAVIVLRTGSVNLADMSIDGWQGQAAEVALATLQVVRTADLSASLGPNEFAICLVHCHRAGAESVGKRLIEQLSGFKCETGIAAYPEDNCEPRALLELARVRVRAPAA